MSSTVLRARLLLQPALTFRRLRLSGAALITALALGLVMPVPSAGATSPEPRPRGADIDGEAAGDASGSSVALSADGLTMAVGAPRNKGTGGNADNAQAGHVRVFVWDGSRWVQRGAAIDGEAAGDQSGYSVALSADGRILAVGAPGNKGADANANNALAGHVRVFEWIDPAWVQRGADIDGEAAGDRSGSSVALSADGLILAVGAPRNKGADENAGSRGHVRVFEWNDPAWVQLGAAIDGLAAGDQSGWSVALSADGRIMAVGAPTADSGAGYLRVYRYDADAVWRQRGDTFVGDARDSLGYSVALSADGTIVAFGAYTGGETDSDAGYVRAYRYDDDAWEQRGSDIDGDDGDFLGISVALSADGDTLATGAPQWSLDAMGFVRIYRFDDGAWVQRGSAIVGDDGDELGTSVALSNDGTIVAIGAPWKDAGYVRVVVFGLDDAGAVTPSSSLSVSCVPSVPVVGGLVTCTVTGGDAGVEILWRAAYNPTFAEAGVTLDASGSGEFTFTVPAAALGEVLTVELVDWLAPMSMGVSGGPVPTSVPSGGGPVPVWPLGLLALAGGLVLRRRALGPAGG